MTIPPSDPSDADLGKWQYSLKSLLIVTTGVCVWASLAKVLYNGCEDRNSWLMLVLIIWLGALFVQGCLHAWAWMWLRWGNHSPAEFPYGRFRVSLVWGAIPLVLWLLLCMILFRGTVSWPPADGGIEILGVTVLHMALPAALLLAGSTRGDRDVYPLRVVRWAVVVSCLVPLTAVAIGIVTKTGW